MKADITWEKLGKKMVPSMRLTLTKAEALWLKGMTQNALTTNESNTDQEIREEFFTTLARWKDLKA